MGRHATVPILLIRPQEPDTRGEQPEIRGILVPLDLSAVSRTILDPVIEFAQLAKAPVTPLYVVERLYQTLGPGVAYPIPQDPDIAVSTRVVIATHGAAGIRRLVLGSVADQVVRGAPKPVLVVRPPEELQH